MTRTVLAIGAHIGDMDLTAGPTLAKLVLEGANATIVALTPGERGHPRLSPSEYKKQKIAEGEAFATAIGADFMVLDHSDGFLPDTDEVAVELATIIREKQPDTIITHWKNSIHSDHEHAARLAERARFLAGLPMDPRAPRIDGPVRKLADLPRHGVRTFLHAENWEDMEGFHPVPLRPHPRRSLLSLGLRHPPPGLRPRRNLRLPLHRLLHRPHDHERLPGLLPPSLRLPHQPHPRSNQTRRPVDSSACCLVRLP